VSKKEKRREERERDIEKNNIHTIMMMS